MNLLEIASILLFFISSFECNKWQLYGPTGTWYYVRYGLPLMNATESENFCVSMGAHLASIHSEEESIFIQDVATMVLKSLKNISQSYTSVEYENSHSFFGLQRVDGHFKYIDGTEMDYTNWREYEPNNADGSEDCVFLHLPKNNVRSQWNDFPCDRKLPSLVCQKQVMSDSTATPMMKLTAPTTLTENTCNEDLYLKATLVLASAVVVLSVVVIAKCVVSRKRNRSLKKFLELQDLVSK